MITYKNGDITKSSEGIIVHGCNTQRKMNSGVAKALRNKWPEATWEPYSVFPRLYLGAIIQGVTSDNSKLIINGITQDRYGYDGQKYVSYDAIHGVFDTINRLPIREFGDALAIPRIGAGLGGGSWEVISSIIESVITNYKVVVYDYS